MNIKERRIVTKLIEVDVPLNECNLKKLPRIETSMEEKMKQQA